MFYQEPVGKFVERKLYSHSNECNRVGSNSVMNIIELLPVF